MLQKRGHRINRMSWKSESSKTTACAPAWGKVVAAGYARPFPGADRGRSTVGFFLSAFSLPRTFPPRAYSMRSSNVATRRKLTGYRLYHSRDSGTVSTRPHPVVLFASLWSPVQPRRNFLWVAEPRLEPGHRPPSLSLLSRSSATGPPRSLFFYHEARPLALLAPALCVSRFCYCGARFHFTRSLVFLFFLQ